MNHNLTISITCIVVIVVLLAAIVLLVDACRDLANALVQERRWEPPEPEVAQAPSGIQQYALQRVVVTDIGNANGWRGVLDEVLDDGSIVLYAAETLTTTRDGKTVAEHTPGQVCIPRSRILMVQVVQD